MRKYNFNVILFLKGMFMGIADIIPGVSGGTIALIVGIYKELIESISKINIDAFKILKNEGVKSAWKYVNGKFIATLFLGIFTSIIIFSKLILFLINNYPTLLWAFFFGLILASIIMLIKKVSSWNIINILIVFFFTIVAYFITVLEPITSNDSNVYIFFSGFIAIIAMILPGISGSFILLILGSYKVILSLIHNITNDFTSSITGLSLFLLGCVLGIVSFSKILNWLFKNIIILLWLLLLEL